MPVSDYTLEVIAAGISFGAACARERFKAWLAYGRTATSSLPAQGMSGPTMATQTAPPERFRS
jgi:hypothetical protein